MVDLAEQWTNVPVQRICKSQEINEDRQINFTSGYTLTVKMEVNGCMNSLNEVRFLEHVQCKVCDSNHTTNNLFHMYCHKYRCKSVLKQCFKKKNFVKACGRDI